MRPRQIIVFAKAPQMGSVKTRLARGIGSTKALYFYRDALNRTIKKALAVRSSETMACVSPDGAVQGRYFPEHLLCRPQGLGDLGQRMARVLLVSPDADRILLGGDIPDVTSADLEAALAALKKHDVVFGPAEDGGFWLVGLRAGFRPRGLFRHMRWSHPGVLKDAIATLPSHATIAFVRTLNDIDDIEDYRRHRAGE